MAVYFIQDTHSRFIKIGHAADPLKRLASLQTASPHGLELLGTVAGGPKEEALLHELFERFHHRGEWFRGDSDLIASVRRLMLTKGSPCTVAEECERRGGCRSGLNGLLVAEIQSADTYVIHHTSWGEHRRLQLSVYLEDDPPPRRKWVGPQTEEEARMFGLGIVMGSWIGTKVVREEPASFLQNAKAEDFVLLSDWPVTCCEPTHRGDSQREA